MDFTLNAAQSNFVAKLDGLAASFETVPEKHESLLLSGDALEQELARTDVFDTARNPELGSLGAALAVERLARLPCAAEFALSMVVRPQLGGDVPRPLAIVEHGRPGRFVATAKTVLVVGGDAVGIAHPAVGDAEAVASLFAYPMGKLKHMTVKALPAADAAKVRTWIRVALAAEMAGLLQATVAKTVDHLTTRQQFGRPIGTFQALRHRMADCAVLAGGVRLMALKAAWSGDAGDAALAALYAQDSATRVVFEAHQMHGGIGITLESPLHLWTYRIKALLSDLGGRGGQTATVAQHCFAATGS